MILCVVHLPVNLNDGSEIKPILRERCLSLFEEITGGLTHWLVNGRWNKINEPMERVLVACEPGKIEVFMDAVRLAGRLTDQDAMYYEIGGKPNVVETREKVAA